MKTVHVVNPLAHASGGSERHALALVDLLRDEADVRLWCTGPPHPQFRDRGPRRVRRRDHPAGGTLVIVGPYFPLGKWIRRARPDRAILVHNLFDNCFFTRRLRQFRWAGWTYPDVAYASDALRRHAGLPGEVLGSWVDVARFRPGGAGGNGTFTIGRLGRDTPAKHHPDDPALFAELAAAGMRVRVMGGTCLGRPPHARVEYLPACAEDAAAFLHSLDAFYFHLPAGAREPFGRVVVEAMACGLPVVAHRDGGYAEWIVDGETALLFDTTAEARAHLLALRDDPGLRARLGAAARAAMEREFGDEGRARRRAFYLA